jgi:1-deoxy-D-xylulose-5-phosphate reductoisomerase
MVEFVDGSIKAQLGLPDMKLPIQYALTYPDRLPMNGARVNFPELREMTFSKPDLEKFPALRLAFMALETGGTAPAVLNAANEVAVFAFLERALSFQNIPRVIEETLHRSTLAAESDVEAIISADTQARMVARSVIDRLSS